MNDNGGCVQTKRSLAIRNERLIHSWAHAFFSFFLLIFCLKVRNHRIHGFPFRHVNQTLDCIICLGGVLFNHMPCFCPNTQRAIIFCVWFRYPKISCLVCSVHGAVDDSRWEPYNRGSRCSVEYNSNSSIQFLTRCFESFLNRISFIILGHRFVCYFSIDAMSGCFLSFFPFLPQSMLNVYCRLE